MTPDAAPAPTPREVRLREALALSEMGRHDRAMAALDGLAAEDGTDVPVQRARVVALLRRGDARAALDAADRALSHGAADPELRRLRGAVLLELGRTAEAVAALREAAADHESAAVLAQLAVAEVRAGDVAAASGHAARAGELDPGGATGPLASGVCDLAACRWVEAERRFRALLLRDHTATALNNLALARLAQGDGAEGMYFLRAAQQASEVTPLANRAVVGNLRAATGSVGAADRSWWSLALSGQTRVFLFLVGFVAVSLVRQPVVLVAILVVAAALALARGMHRDRGDTRLRALPLVADVWVEVPRAPGRGAPGPRFTPGGPTPPSTARG